MIFGSGNVTFEILDVMQGTGSAVFNYFFTQMMVFGIIALMLGMLFKVLNRS